MIGGAYLGQNYLGQGYADDIVSSSRKARIVGYDETASTRKARIRGRTLFYEAKYQTKSTTYTDKYTTKAI